MISLGAQLRRVRRRLLGIGAAAAAVWGLAAVTILLLLGAWLDLLWEFPPQWRIATFWVAGASGVVLLAALSAATLRAARDAAVARRLDRAGQLGGRVLTGWELAQEQWSRRGGQTPRALTLSLANIAVADAAVAAGQIPVGKVAPVRPLGRSLGAIALLGIAVAALAVCLPGLVGTQWNRFVRPFADVPPFSPIEFKVTPGNARVVYGSELEIRVTVIGPPVEQLELVLEAGNHQEPPLPMFPEADGQWRAVLARVVEPTNYYVRAYRARSKRYHLGIITVPLIDNARLRIEPPAYANQAAYEGPLPKEGVCGLPGTKVQIVLHSNRPLGGGTISLSGACGAGVSPASAAGTATGTAAPAAGTAAPQRKPTRRPMKPIEPGGQEVVGQFAIAGDGKFSCRVIDEDGQESQQTFSGNVTMLADQWPFVRITEPPRTSLATPTAALPVTISAEDDCGISRLQLYRSLNDSRPLPFDLPLPARPSRRLDEQVRLPLQQYGLEPGDVIKLFARVEDNDPAGAKGAESSVVMVRIISQEEFERMLQTRQGIEALLSKYYAAQRRMESLAKKMDGLRKKVKGQRGEAKRSEEMRRQLEQLVEAMRREAAEIRKAADSAMPYDIDKALTPELQELAKTSEEMAKELEQLEREKDLLNRKLGGRLDQMAKRLASARKLYDEQAVEPMELMAGVLPLLADQQRFVMLALWQQDLAERLSSLKGRDGQDDPSMKARMRDLEEEQRQVRDALASFLDSVQEHIDKLPDKEELKEFRESAEKFVKDLRKSGAAEAMAGAESALGEFAPTRGHKKAQQAADILKKFIKECKGMGNCACKGLKFQPTVCKAIGNSLEQLLAAMGMGSGMGGGSGMDGFGPTGLYGGLPPALANPGEASGGGEGNARREGGSPINNRDGGPPGELFAPGAAAGANAAAVPVRYRRQVGQYFQHVAEETGESGQ